MTVGVISALRQLICEADTIYRNLSYYDQPGLITVARQALNDLSKAPPPFCRFGLTPHLCIPCHQRFWRFTPPHRQHIQLTHCRLG